MRKFLSIITRLWRPVTAVSTAQTSYQTAAESLYHEYGQTAAFIILARNHGIPYATFEQVVREQARAGGISEKSMQFTLDLTRLLYDHTGIEAIEALQLMKLGGTHLVEHPTQKETDHA